MQAAVFHAAACSLFQPAIDELALAFVFIVAMKIGLERDFLRGDEGAHRMCLSVARVRESKGEGKRKNKYG